MTNGTLAACRLSSFLPPHREMFRRTNCSLTSGLDSEIMTATIEFVHCPEPPCSCDSCLRATAKADQRRAELDEIFRRLDDAEQMATSEADE